VVRLLVIRLLLDRKVIIGKFVIGKVVVMLSECFVKKDSALTTCAL
jgi:hypothetical protein